VQSDHDVIIVGSGPAGATLAYELASSGVAVLVIDKAIFPRPKCCGGGVTIKASNLLGEIPHDITEDSVSRAMFNISGTNLYDGDFSDTLIHTVNREKFDHFLVQRAEKAGAHIIQGTTVTDLQLSTNNIEVASNQGTFRSPYVVGADGNRSVVSKYFCNCSHNRFIGIETEVQVGDQDLEKWKSRILIDLGWPPKGYAWLFPKHDHLSIGIGAPFDKARHLKKAYWEFLNSLKFNRYKIRSRSAAVIPMFSGKPRVVSGRIALLGDAAGLADPLTGEGIGNALLSAQLAAPAIKNAVQHGITKLQAYQTSIEEKLVPEIEAARFLSRIIYSIPKKLLNLARQDNRLWNAGCSLVRGELSYQTIRGKAGTVKGLYSILRGK
jgi:geranylgeranyl reductase family protein